MNNKLKKKLINSRSGFIALFSVIIISFVLILISTTLSFNSFSTRFNIFDSESKIKSRALANACLESARLALTLDNNYLIDNIIIDVGEDSCDYSILNTTPYQTIISHSVVNNAHTYLKIEVSINIFSVQIISYQEIQNSI